MDFTFVSGEPALDFAGTLQHRRTDRRDLLRSPADLARWTVAAGLLAEPPSDPSEADLSWAVELRETIYRLAYAAHDGLPYDQEDVARLNSIAARPPLTPRLGTDGALERAGGLRAALVTVARGAVELLGGPASHRIQECGAEPCTRLYVDASRRGFRRWCDMGECGNRAKAAAFRARHKA